MGNYVHGNEPSYHVPYLYAWTNEPWKGQYRLIEIMTRMYKNKTRRALRERRLRTNVSLVCLLYARVLSCMSRF